MSFVNSKTENPSEEDIVEKYEKLKRDLAELEREERQLKNYLNTNVFDYAQNKQNVEDIFSIHNSSMSFLDVDATSKKINPNIPVIEINGLTKLYPSRKVPSLVNVSLRLYLGDVHVVVGPSGAGKTTLFNCLRGIEDYEGEILIEGKEFNSHPSFYSDQLISFVTNEFGWDSYATVEDVIFSRFQELNMTEIEMQNYVRSSLESMGMSYARNLHIIDLNMLEKRKVQIIVSLITDPHVVVLDDIFLGLQQYECFELLVTLSKMKQSERAILLLIHSFNDLFKFADSMTILSEGKVFYTGDASAFLGNKAINYVLSVDDNGKAIDILRSIGECSFDYKETMDVFLVNFESNLSLCEFQQECAKQRVIIKELKLLEPRIEDLFPLLKFSGNREAIKVLNTRAFFTPQ